MISRQQFHPAETNKNQGDSRKHLPESLDALRQRNRYKHEFLLFATVKINAAII